MNRSLPLVLCLVCFMAIGGGPGGAEAPTRAPELRAALQVGASSLLSGRQWWHLMAGAAASASLAAATGDPVGACPARGADAGHNERAGARARAAAHDGAGWVRAAWEEAGHVRLGAIVRAVAPVFVRDGTQRRRGPVSPSHQVRARPANVPGPRLWPAAIAR